MVPSSAPSGALDRGIMATLDDQLIAMLYGAVDCDQRWVDLMNMLRQRFGVESVAAQYLVATHNDLMPLWCSRDSVSQSRAALHDSWANSLANPRFRRPIGPARDMEIDSDHRSVDYSPQDRRALFDGLARCGLGPAFWISQQIDPERHFTLIFHRAPGDARDMEASEHTLLQAMAPHFGQVVRLWERLAAAEAHTRLVEQAGEGMMTALVACDGGLRTHWLNAHARHLLDNGDVLGLHRGRLACALRADQERLAALVEGRSDRPVVALGGGDLPIVHLRVQAPSAVAGRFALHRDTVLLAITRPDRALRYDPQDIAQLFGLTTTEAALAASLAAGASVCDFAEARGVAEGTARLHLKRVLAKTGAGRQSELVRRICLSVAGRPA
ncbi:hypothetical protein AQZ49_19970 [Novosphingobium sp. FSW06-99]|nr:hypothetical protein AQZ49_19970 [Novosphingobium sp. FSW06-99]